MGAFRFRRAGGGSALRGGEQLRNGDPSIGGDAHAQASASGTLSTQIKLAGAAAAQASASGALSTQIKLAGSPAAQAAATGTLTDYVVPTPPQHATRIYEEYLRGPILAVGSAVQFDGANDYGSITALTDLSGDSVTIECWWQGADFESVFRQQNGANYIAFGWRSGTGTGNPKFLLSNDGATAGLDGGAVIQDGNPHHVAMVWERNAANGFRVLVDGVRVAQRASANVAIPNVAAAAYLASFIGTSERATGKLQELRVWSTARTDQQINEYMGVRALGSEAGLKLCYHTLETSGTTLADATPNGYTCTLVNGPALAAAIAALAPPLQLGTVESYRGGGWSVPCIAAFSDPADNALGDFGIQEGGGFSVDVAAHADLPVDLVTAAQALRHQTCELELVTKLIGDDGSLLSEITHVRRAVVKRATQKKNVLTLALADVDREALAAVFPFETFAVTDFPELFSEHVGRRVPQGVGTVVRVPLAWVKKTGGAQRWAGPKVVGATGTLLAVYRGDSPGRGALVASSEYLPGTLAAAVSGFTVHTVDFPAEQSDFQGRPYVLEADYLLPGSRQPTDEVQRLLALYGVATEATSFVGAAAYDAAAGFAIDALYGGDQGRTGNAIVEDLLRVARAWLTQTATGAWAIVQDRPAIPVMAYDATIDQVDVEEYGDDEVPKSVTVEYRPRRAGVEDFEGKLPARTTGGSSGELAIKNPYIRDHTVADMLGCYHAKRLATLRRAAANAHCVQLDAGDMITIDREIAWGGTKKRFLIEGVSRPADANRFALREYDADVYVYTAGTLPTGATNVYGPDYSFTMPAAPTALTVVSQGTSVDNDGKVTAYALIRATPPSVNWSRLMVQVTDTTTNEIYQAQLLLNAGNYEATVSGLRPNRAHQVVTWAVNANNIDGAIASPVAFTSANYTGSPAAPTGLAVAQGTGKALRVSCTAPSVAGFSELVWFRKVGAGSYAEYRRGKVNFLIDENVSYGSTYYYKAQVVVQPGNASADSAEVSITPSTNIDDSQIVPLGVSGASIANGSINQGRGYTGTGSGSISLNAAPNRGQLSMDVYTFYPGIDKGGSAAVDVYLVAPASKPGAGDFGVVALRNLDSSTSVTVNIGWRNFLS